MFNMSVSLDIRLKRASKIYQDGVSENFEFAPENSINCQINQDSVSGIVVISSPNEVKHEGMHLTLDGMVNLELSSKSIGQYEAFYNSVKVWSL